jgi:hypothetical protein
MNYRVGMGRGLMPHIIFPSDIVAMQARLLAAAAGTDQSVQACPALDAPTRASWNYFYAAVQKFCALTPVYLFPTGETDVLATGSLMDQAEAYEDEVFAWQHRLAEHCTLTVPLFDPNAASKGQGDQVVSVFKYIAIAAGFVATAYGVAKIVELIPHPAPRKQLKE